MGNLRAAQREHDAAIRALAEHLADVATGGAPMDRVAVAEWLLTLDGGSALEDETLYRIDGRTVHDDLAALEGGGF